MKEFYLATGGLMAVALVIFLIGYLCSEKTLKVIALIFAVFRGEEPTQSQQQVDNAIIRSTEIRKKFYNAAIFFAAMALFFLVAGLVVIGSKHF